jgi:hypothetical protein
MNWKDQLNKSMTGFSGSLTDAAEALHDAAVLLMRKHRDLVAGVGFEYSYGGHETYLSVDVFAPPGDLSWFTNSDYQHCLSSLLHRATFRGKYPQLEAAPSLGLSACGVGLHANPVMDVVAYMAAAGHYGIRELVEGYLSNKREWPINVSRSCTHSDDLQVLQLVRSRFHKPSPAHLALLEDRDRLAMAVYALQKAQYPMGLLFRTEPLGDKFTAMRDPAWSITRGIALYQ